MIRAAIVDDELPARQYLRLLLERIAEVDVVGEAEEGEECLRLLATAQPDVVFLDIRLPGISGLELAHIIGGMRPKPSVVFVTGYDQYAVQAFDLAAVDFLTKPYSEDRLRKTLNRIAERTSGDMKSVVAATAAGGPSNWISNKLPIKYRDGWKLIDVKSILYAKTDSRKVRIQTGDDAYSCHYTLAELEQRLPSNRFFRANEGCLVNLVYVQEIVSSGPRSYELLMSGPKTIFIPLSRSKAQKLRELLKLH